MKNIKNQQSKSKASISAAAQSQREDYVSFSFCNMTSNTRYSFDFFNSNRKRDKSEAMAQLGNKLHQIGKMEWAVFRSLNSKAYVEYIPINRLHFSPPSHFTVSRDEKFISIQFCQQDYRIIGIKRENCPILHIIGYDFDHSAYDH